MMQWSTALMEAILTSSDEMHLTHSHAAVLLQRSWRSTRDARSPRVPSARLSSGGGELHEPKDTSRSGGEQSQRGAHPTATPFGRRPSNMSSLADDWVALHTVVVATNACTDDLYPLVEGPLVICQ
eukprot:CAMPEP_0181189244 /NCGR_PEP_ID=MMETSP1096-20121128/11559_1 /TAXON_ID=156174 ORGANISM="Chrysochromulina ericina, Strain CCMP281" /NCGR_SAMPLE_ID=MMETSP1096 /ASSEMBLY_ACC=CAM_ASM_000453 /LENGTH=125 /DNA_ID=CAMNT_0023278385 /DNA_START=45 /DNA_END=422 /DNA_ORIENTATION=-